MSKYSSSKRERYGKQLTQGFLTPGDGDILKFDIQAPNICRKVSQQVAVLKRMKNILPHYIRKNIYTSFISTTACPGGPESKGKQMLFSRLVFLICITM